MSRIANDPDWAEWLTRQALVIGGCNADLLGRFVNSLSLQRHLSEKRLLSGMTLLSLA